MWLSRIRLVPGVSLFDERVLALSNEYSFHQWVWRLFPGQPEASRSFLYRLERSSDGFVVYLVSRNVPEDKDGLLAMETKPYAPSLAPGQCLDFSLRVNPVVTRPDSSGNPKRHDVVMDLKRRSTGSEELPEGMREASLVQQAVVAWLQKRCQGYGFDLVADSAVCGSYQQHLIAARGRERPVRFSSVDIAGRLLVREPESLLKALFHGVGPAKGFGCGLLLVRRAP